MTYIPFERENILQNFSFHSSFPVNLVENEVVGDIFQMEKKAADWKTRWHTKTMSDIVG